VLAGLAVFEREIHWFARELEDLQREYLPQITEPVHFHVTKLRTREGDSLEPPWDSLPRERRLELKDRVYDVIRNRRGVLFGCVIDREYTSGKGEEPYERAFEDIISRFDMFMSRLNRVAVTDGREEQRALIVLAESSAEQTIRMLARRFQQDRTRWGQLHNVTDVPFFASARDTRLLQFADFCANAIYGRYSKGLAKDFDRIAGKFDQEDGVVHGLVHLTLDYSCVCPACATRRTRRARGNEGQLPFA